MKNEQKPMHTPEPWSVQAGTKKWEISGKGWIRFAKVVKRMKHSSVDCADGEANARRIVACVNACEGISTEMLELAGDSFWERTDGNFEALFAENAQLREKNKQLATALSDAMKALIQPEK